MDDTRFIAQVTKALESERFFLIRNMPTPYALDVSYQQINTMLKNIKVFGIEYAMDIAYSEFADWAFTEHGCFRKA